MTFVLARRPYRWAWDPASVRSMLSFGWPLLLNGWVMFGCQQADQIVVGAVFSLNLLANYALALSLVSIPWFILGQVGVSLIVPVLSRAQDDPDRFRRQYRVCADASAAAGVIAMLPLILVGEQLITLLYGEKYHGTGGFVAVLGAAVAVRFLRFAPAAAATARADTLNQLYSNLWREASLPLALGVVAVGGKPIQIAACALAGEVLAAVVSMVRLWRRQGVPLQDNYGASAYMVVLISLGLGLALFGTAAWTLWQVALTAIGGFVIALYTARLLFPEVSRFVIEGVGTVVEHRRRAARPTPTPVATT